jgi:hypothetical protein
VEPLSFLERINADNVFSPNEALPAPMTVMMVMKFLLKK